MLCMHRMTLATLSRKRESLSPSPTKWEREGPDPKDWEGEGYLDFCSAAAIVSITPRVLARISLFQNRSTRQPLP